MIEDIDERACETVVKILVGTKSDLVLERKVASESAQALCQQLGIKDYIETSSKENFQVEAAFQLATLYLKNQLEDENINHVCNSVLSNEAYEPKKHFLPQILSPGISSQCSTSKAIKSARPSDPVSIIKKKVEEQFGKLDAHGFPIGGEYSGKMDPQRAELRKKLLNAANDLSSANMGQFISDIKNMAKSAQTHHEKESGGLMASWKTCNFKQHVDNIVNEYDALIKTTTMNSGLGFGKK